MEIEQYVGSFDLEKTLDLRGGEEIIFGSGSPRRIEMIQKLKRPIAYLKSDLNEESFLKEEEDCIRDKDFIRKASILTTRLAYEKAKSLETEDGNLLITADTTVLMRNKILGKPKTQKDAEVMLKSLFGQIHFVTTGVCLYQSQDKKDLFYTTTAVKFKDLSPGLERVLHKYVKDGKAQDKAGAYGIQEEAGLFVDWVYGDYPSIIGLPLGQVYERIEKIL